MTATVIAFPRRNEGPFETTPFEAASGQVAIAIARNLREVRKDCSGWQSDLLLTLVETADNGWLARAEVVLGNKLEETPSADLGKAWALVTYARSPKRLRDQVDGMLARMGDAQ